jgi:hypothetical protein
MVPEVCVPFGKIPIDRSFSFVHRFVIAAMDDGTRHAAEDGLDHVQELGAGRQWRGFDLRASAIGYRFVMSFNAREEFFGDMPRRCIPREVKLSVSGISIN